MESLWYNSVEDASKGARLASWIALNFFIALNVCVRLNVCVLLPIRRNCLTDEEQ